MDVEEIEDPGMAVSRIAGAIGEPARARMLSALMDGRARTSTELAIVADVSPATASAHLRRLTDDRLVLVSAQGRHRYFSLAGPSVARVLEALNVLASDVQTAFIPTTPIRLRAARTCYDHMGGSLAVALHDRFLTLKWMRSSRSDAEGYEFSADGAARLAAFGIDVDALRGARRRFAYGCLDWSERRPHLGGSVAAAVLDALVRRRWIVRDDDSRVLSLSAAGRRELHARFGVPREVMTPLLTVPGAS